MGYVTLRNSSLVNLRRSCQRLNRTSSASWFLPSSTPFANKTTTASSFAISSSAGLSSRNRILSSRLAFSRSFSTKPKIENEFKLVYEGVHSNKVKYGKRISLGTLSLSVAAAPFILTYVDASLMQRCMIASCTAFIGVLTTVVLHKVAKTYVCKLYFNTSTITFAAETLSVLATPVQKEFHLRDIEPPGKRQPLLTFVAETNQYIMDMTSAEMEEMILCLLMDVDDKQKEEKEEKEQEQEVEECES